MGSRAEGGQEEPPRLVPARAAGGEGVPTKAGGSGSGSGSAQTVIDALKSSAEEQLTMAERVSGKARQAFALAAGVFVVSQTVAFGNFDTKNIRPYEKHWIIGFAIGAVGMLAIAAFATLKADATVKSGGLPLDKMEKELNAALVDGDDEGVMGRVGGYYLGVVRSRRKANKKRTKWYKAGRFVVTLSLLATVAELIVSLLARAS